MPGGTSVIVPPEFSGSLADLNIPMQCAVLPGNPKASNSDRREELVIENLPARIPNGPTIMCAPFAAGFPPSP